MELTDEQVEYLYTSTRYMVMAKHCLNANEVEEMTQAVVAHLSKYWNYDPSKGYAWKTYASNCIQNRIATEMRTHWISKSRTVELADDEWKIEARPESSYGEDLELIDALVEDETIRRILKLKYEGYNCIDIAKITGIRARTLWRVIQLLKDEMRQALDKGTKMDCGKALRILHNSGGQVGRPIAYVVEMLNDKDEVIATYDHIVDACKATGYAYKTIAKGKDGVREWNGKRWRIVTKTCRRGTEETCRNHTRHAILGEKGGTGNEWKAC